MPHPPNLDHGAPWKQRYRAATMFTSQIAAHAPERGLVASNRSGTLQWYAWDVPSCALRQLNTPISIVWSAYYTPDSAMLLAHLQDATQPTQLGALDPRSGDFTHTVLAAGTTPPGRALHSVSFMSSDGELIQGWLGTPDGDGPFPTILDMHGGPNSVHLNNCPARRAVLA